MIIKSVKLSNIRSYRECSIDFPTGSIMLSGDIGAGKSTILLAIEFALFGVTSELDGSALLRNGAAAGEVELKLKIEGRDITIRRALKRAKESVRQEPGHITINGERKSLMPVELKARVLELLGYPKELLTKSKSLIYRYTVYTPQEEMKLILLDNNTNRLDTLRKVFQIDKYKRIKENTQTLTRAIRARAGELEARAEGLQEDLDRKESLEREAEEMQKKISELIPAIQGKEKLIREQKAKQQRLEEKQKAYYEAQKSLEIHRTRAESKLKQAADADREAKALEEQTTLLNAKQQEAEKQQPEFSALLAAAKSEQQRLMQATAAKQGIRDGLSEAEAELAGMAGEARTQRYIAETARKAITSITSMQTCTMCRQPVTAEHKEHIRKQEEEKAKAAEQETARAEQQRKQLEHTQKELHAELDRISEMEKELAALSIEIAAAEETGKAAAGGIRHDMNRLRILTRQLRETRHYTEMLAEKQRTATALAGKKKLLLEEAEEHRKHAEEALKKADSQKTAQAEMESAKKELEELQLQEKTLNLEKATTETRLQANQNSRREAEEQAERKKTAKQEAEKLRKTTFWLDEHFTGLVETIEKQTMLRAYNEFNSYFQNWFSTLMEDQAISIRLDEEFTPIIEQNGYEMPFENLSGGERTSCALAYRLALNKVINDMVTTIKTRDILILDEPTEGFSSEQLERVRDVISQLKTQQVIIVSHEQKVESFVNHVIRVRKEEHSSSVS